MEEQSLSVRLFFEFLDEDLQLLIIAKE